MAASATFHPSSNLRALLDQLYDVKFSKHTPLVVVLLSMVYTIYRTRHYLGTAFTLDAWVAWPTAIFIELLVLAASAAMFIALRGAFVAELKTTDEQRSRYGVYLALIALGLAFVALLFVAGADAWSLTKAYIPTFIMTLIQAAQMIFMMLFIIAADLDEREQLRQEYASWKAGTCPYCLQPVSPNNRARHIAACPNRP
jgi:hypothetical protein